MSECNYFFYIIKAIFLNYTLPFSLLVWLTIQIFQAKEDPFTVLVSLNEQNL